MPSNSRIQAVERATNMTWDEWLRYMESINAKNLTHHEIATILLDKLNGQTDNIGWWAQSVTVTYEQYIGRRIPGQRTDGTFQSSVSKATPLGMSELMDAWSAFAEEHPIVMAIISGTTRVSGTSNRITWRAKAKDGSSLVVISEPKRDGKASIVVQSLGLQTHDLNMEAKQRWGLILDELVASLSRSHASG